MSKPLWWKNSVKLIKKFTTNDSFMTFDRNGDDVYFLYHVKIDGMEIVLEEIVSIDALESNLQDQIYEEVHDSLRSMLLGYLDDFDRENIVGM